MSRAHFLYTTNLIGASTIVSPSHITPSTTTQLSTCPYLSSPRHLILGAYSPTSRSCQAPLAGVPHMETIKVVVLKFQLYLGGILVWKATKATKSKAWPTPYSHPSLAVARQPINLSATVEESTSLPASLPKQANLAALPTLGLLFVTIPLNKHPPIDPLHHLGPRPRPQGGRTLVKTLATISSWTLLQHSKIL